QEPLLVPDGEPLAVVLDLHHSDLAGERRQIGEDKLNNAGWRSAVGGTPASELVHRDAFSAFEGVVTNRDLVSSYLPVRNEAGDILGVVELYADVTPMLTQIKATSARVQQLADENQVRTENAVSTNAIEARRQSNAQLTLTAALFALLYLALFMIVRYGQRVIDGQDRARTSALTALEESEARYRNLIELSPDAIAVYQNGKVQYVNAAAIELFGSASAEEMASKDIFDFIHPSSRALAMQRVKRIYEDGGSAPMAEMKFVKLDKSVIDVEVQSSVIAINGKRLVCTNIRDITNRKRAELALVASERRSTVLAELGRQLAEAATRKVAAIHMLNAAQELLRWDSAWLHTWDAQNQKMINVVDFDLMPGGIREVPAFFSSPHEPTPNARLVMAEGPQLILRETETDDGAGVYMYGSGRISLSLLFVPIRLGEQLIGVLSIQSYERHAYDYDDLDLLYALATHCAGALARLEHAEALHAGEERFQLINRAMFNVIWDQRLPSKEIWWSEHVETVYGYKPEEIGRNGDFWRAHLHPDDQDRVVLAVAAALVSDADNWFESYRFRGKDGGYTFVEERALIIRDSKGSATRLIGAMQDVSKRKRAEIALREGEERYRTLIEWSPEPIAVNREGRMIYVNPAALRMFGAASPADLVGRAMIELIHPDFHAMVRARTREAVAAASGVLTPLAEMTFLKLDGTTIDVEVHSTAIVYDGGPAIYVSMRDVSEKKQADAARVSLESQLRESQKMEAIGTLAGGIAHDFNNIIATILGNTELARQDASDNPRARESLEEIQKAGVRARDLVQQILSFSRRQPTQLKPASLLPIAEESVRLLRATLPARVVLAIHAGAALPPVLADATQIQQILINLCTNAMHAMHGKPGRIDIGLDAVVLDAVLARTHPALTAMHAEYAGTAVRLTVSDDGAGMDESTVSRIFEPFFTTKPVDQGTGLGLSVVHGIVQNHQGAIVVDSTPGAGTRFTLYLPATEVGARTDAPAAPAAAPPSAKVADAANGPHILYLDDDESLVSLVKRLLERRGMRVSGYIEQRAALDALYAAPKNFDLVVTDYNMPGMSGLDVAREVRAIRADLPVAVTSGFIDETLRAQAAGAGVRELIFKASAVED
ncbi:MAG: PAS domain S-box protein, partial [Usitatibacteraceae bacterium]